MNKLAFVAAAWLLPAIAGCRQAQYEGGSAIVPKELSAPERSLGSEVGLPEDFLKLIKGAGGKLRRLEGVNLEGDPVQANGVTIDVSHDAASGAARRLQELAPPGFMAFVSERRFGIRGALDEVSVLKVSSPYDALEVMGTNGWNYDISPEAIIDRLKKWDQRFGIVLRGVGFDWLEAEFKNPPPDMLEFAKEVYQFCPDVVEQGTYTVEALAAEMKRTNSVYLWWD